MPAERRGAGRWSRDVPGDGRLPGRHARPGSPRRREPRPHDGARTVGGDQTAVDDSPRESPHRISTLVGVWRCRPEAVEPEDGPWDGWSILLEVPPRTGEPCAGNP